MKRERRKDRVEGGLCKCKERKWVHGSVMIDATMLSLHWWYGTETSGLRMRLLQTGLIDFQNLCYKVHA